MVLRGKVGDEITVGDGEGRDYTCKLTEIDKKCVTAEITDIFTNDNEPKVKITLFQGLPKADKMELVIQKCIEIGVDSIVPVKTEHTVVKLDGKEEKKRPAVRFKGFEDDWEQRKFGEIADYKKGPFGSSLKKEIFVPEGPATVKIS